MSNVVNFQKHHFQKNFQSQYERIIRLVENTASYLDGNGRKDSQKLSTMDQLEYAKISMCLTTEIMSLMSFFLLKKALQNNEINQQEYEREMIRVSLDSKNYSLDNMPKNLIELIEETNKIKIVILRWI